MNVLGLDFSWVLEINSHISELKKPVSWAVSQMKGNSLKSVMFFTSKLKNHFTSISKLISFVCFATAVSKVSVCWSVCPPWKPSSNQSPKPTRAVLGLVPWNHRVGRVGRGPWRWPGSSPACVGSLSEPSEGFEMQQHHGMCWSCCSLCSPLAKKQLQGDVHRAQSEGKCRDLNSVLNSK